MPFPTDLASFLDLIHQHGDVAYSLMFAYAASHSLLLVLFAGFMFMNARRQRRQYQEQQQMQSSLVPGDRVMVIDLVVLVTATGLGVPATSTIDPVVPAIGPAT